MNSLISKIPTEPISFREIKNRPLEIRSKNFRETEVQQFTLNQSRNAHYSRYVLMLQLLTKSIVYDFCLYSQDPVQTHQ